jgi:phosphoglycolate phosphatase-like HAD superfamily hydrolase
VIEIIRAGASASRAKAVIFDFDGTISLIRSGWMGVMIPLCVEQLSKLNTGESEEELRSTVEEFVWHLTGKETIYQMMALAEAVEKRGGRPLEPLAYKRIYLDHLWLKIRNRVEGLRAGSAKPEQYMVPGARELLERLVEQGLRLYLASGTDHVDVNEEAALLGVSRYFGERVYGAQDDLKSFSKAILVQQILARTGGLQPDELLVFGDGYVEIEEVKKAGGIAVGVATAEPECLEVDPWKRRRLINAGADYIIPNYLACDELCSTLLSASAIMTP